eukprot:TRINITY_DN2584_c0_g1_i1.p1 TRINITY_DN2584_c0_g1~~TRINITY_DN2584_c0_g1_i1.p1  ORF type:complete len:746 (+),score=184.32 TRINITY_DN2584_c0_g1_i1:77-2314(+)
MLPAFTFSIQQNVSRGLVTIGKFDGTHPALACCVGLDSIVIHSPHLRDSNSRHEVRQLAVNRRVTALCSGVFNTKSFDQDVSSSIASSSSSLSSFSSSSSKSTNNEKKTRDILLIGSPTNLLAYDVEENSDVFFNTVQDGVNCLAFGCLNPLSGPVCVVGGNLSLQAFDSKGHDVFWTVCGDNVSALAFKKQKDQKNQLLVGSEDFAIRVFSGEEIVHETTEADVVTGLVQMRDNSFGYSLGNGTIGVYKDMNRSWYAKSKHKVMAINAFDLDNDGVPELISGWANGKIEVRKEDTGELIYKDRCNNSIAGLLVADYRMDGKIELIACSTNGEIRGYLPADKDLGGRLMDSTQSEATLKALYDQKQELLNELKNYDNNTKQIKSGKLGAGVIPPNTKLSLTLKPSRSQQGLLLTLATNNDTVVKLALIFSDGIFEGESLVCHPQKPSPQLAVTLQPPKDVETELKLKVIVGQKSSIQDHVFELTYQLEKFASYMLVKPKDVIESKSHVTITTPTAERVNRVALWIHRAFNIDEKSSAATMITVTSTTLQAAFVCVRDGSPLLISMNSEDRNSVIQISTDNMDLAGDIVQDLCHYLKIDDVESIADFPTEMNAFQQVLQRVDEYNSIRLKMSAEIADSSNLVKDLVMRAENSRLLNDMPLMLKMYQQLYNVNQELIGEYEKRANNHIELLKHLKQTNLMIQKAAKLRVGNPKNAVIQACRKALKSNNTQLLLKIIKMGGSSVSSSS